MPQNESPEDGHEPTEEELRREAAEYHRMAAHHFQMAAKHHAAAAEASEDADWVTVAAQAYLAYGHQLRGVGYAEIAAEDEFLGDTVVSDGEEQGGN